jgi:hypothetical protein
MYGSATVQRSEGYIAFSRNALMFFVCTFDVILELPTIVWELFGHFVDPAWHIATDCRPEGHALTGFFAPQERLRGDRSLR